MSDPQIHQRGVSCPYSNIWSEGLPCYRIDCGRCPQLYFGPWSTLRTPLPWSEEAKDGAE